MSGESGWTDGRRHYWKVWLILVGGSLEFFHLIRIWRHHVGIRLSIGFFSGVLILQRSTVVNELGLCRMGMVVARALYEELSWLLMHM